MHKRSMLSRLGWIYIALIALWLVLRAIFFDQIWWLAFRTFHSAVSSWQ
jgi:hypothetical protein